MTNYSKHINKIIITCVTFMVAVITFVSYTKDNDKYTKEDSNNVIILENKITQSNKNNSKVTFEYELDEDCESNKRIVFFSNHERVKVLVDDTVIYSLSPNENSIIKTTGDSWNVIDIEKDYIGKTISIQKESVYGDKIKNFNCYYGSEKDIYDYILKKKLSAIILNIMIIIIGVILLIYSYMINKRYESSNIRYRAYFTILLGVWRMTEHKFTLLLFTNGLLMNLVRHLSLMFLPVFFVEYISRMYPNPNKDIFKNLKKLNVFILVYRNLVQMLGIYDYYETLWMIHLNIVIIGIVVMIETIKELRHKTISKGLRYRFVGMAMIILSVGVDLISYQLYKVSKDTSSFAYFVYIMIVGIQILRKTSREIELDKELSIYKKLAYVDELTNSYNRMAYERDIESYDFSIKEDNNFSLAIIMFDLNNLKACNDYYGHQYGDKYIIMMSNIFKKAFKDKKQYRIGGDEFCVLMTDTSEDIIKEKLSYIDEKIKERKDEFDIDIGTAYGYAVYDSKLDKNLKDTRHRADIYMYEHKRLMKK